MASCCSGSVAARSASTRRNSVLPVRLVGRSEQPRRQELIWTRLFGQLLQHLLAALIANLGQPAGNDEPPLQLVGRAQAHDQLLARRLFPGLRQPGQDIHRHIVGRRLAFKDLTEHRDRLTIALFTQQVGRPEAGLIVAAVQHLAQHTRTLVITQHVERGRRSGTNGRVGAARDELLERSGSGAIPELTQRIGGLGLHRRIRDRPAAAR